MYQGSRGRGAGTGEQGQGSRGRGAGAEEQGQRSRDRGAGAEEQGQGSRGRGAGTGEQGQELSSPKICLTQMDRPTAIINSIAIATVHEQYTQ